MSAKRNYTEAMAKVKAARELARKEASNALVEGLAEIFAAFPKLQSLGWPQYTPYFNDGDTCEFGVRADEWSLRLNGGNDDYGDEYEEDQELTEEEHSEIAKEVSKFIRMFEEDDLKAIYGDHVMVVINRDGTSATNDYSHD